LILVDTSIWVDHLRAEGGPLGQLLQANMVCTHNGVIGELACGTLRNRTEILALLRGLPRLAAASEDEVLFFIERHRLMGRGIGYADVHLLAAAALHGAYLRTRDKRLKEIAEELDLAYLPAEH